MRLPLRLKLAVLIVLAPLGLAACGPPQVALNVQLTGDGQGTVTSRPPGLSCSGKTCSGSFAEGTPRAARGRTRSQLPALWVGTKDVRAKRAKS